jgi:hypothetical protein
MINVQRLNDSGPEKLNFNEGLRYSLVPGLAHKYSERRGSDDHEVKFNISFRPVTQCYTLSAGSISPATPAISNASLYVDYIYLDTDERRQFAQVQHEKNVLESKHQKCLLVIAY